MDEGRLPTALMVDAVLRQCDIDFIPYYVVQRGEYASGIVLAKFGAAQGQAALRIQQRDFDTGKLGWVNALGADLNEESQVDAYISRSIQRDPDLWVIEFETRDGVNPFETSGL